MRAQLLTEGVVIEDYGDRSTWHCQYLQKRDDGPGGQALPFFADGRGG
jgi:hypothetical protein